MAQAAENSETEHPWAVFSVPVARDAQQFLLKESGSTKRRESEGHLSSDLNAERSLSASVPTPSAGAALRSVHSRTSSASPRAVPWARIRQDSPKSRRHADPQRPKFITRGGNPWTEVCTFRMGRPRARPLQAPGPLQESAVFENSVALINC